MLVQRHSLRFLEKLESRAPAAPGTRKPGQLEDVGDVQGSTGTVNSLHFSLLGCRVTLRALQSRPTC